MLEHHVCRRSWSSQPRQDVVGGEFIGVLFRDDEDEDETAYQFKTAILDYDLQ